MRRMTSTYDALRETLHREGVSAGQTPQPLTFGSRKSRETRRSLGTKEIRPTFERAQRAKNLVMSGLKDRLSSLRSRQSAASMCGLLRRVRSFVNSLLHLFAQLTDANES